MLLWVAIAGALASGLTYVILSNALRALDDDVRPDVSLPSMTVVRPVRGLDPGLDENTQAALRVRYPAELETIFVVDDEHEPALPVLERVIEREGSSARVVIAGPPPRGRTGKLHAMIVGLRAARARTPLVCFADSDTRPSTGLLEELASAVVASRDVGAAFARAIGTRPPRTLGDVGYGLLLDGIYGPQVALASRRSGSLPFVMGQTMVLRRTALEACGGLEGSSGELVDDMNIGARLAATGYRNVLWRSPIAIVQEGLPTRDLRGTALRWMVFARTGIPFWPYSVPAAIWVGLYALGIVGALVSMAIADVTSGALFAATSVSVVASLEALRRQQGGAPTPLSLWWAPFVCLAMVPWWFACAHFTRAIVWRGRSYELDARGRLGVLDAAPARVPQMPPQMP
ncbi:glycosyltransferase [Sandaracinus amylolyticus]|uniref:Putatiave glycosyltransferase n=1 Tax=Sandaracinus amylolyticus TaxID=927083 RepID=A0A0F6W9M0_9BACT|nr:glycosyltransferase [Sandaracinus amylolyticus]AKF10911.1 putatiave glycosyltransferase [Sandaracinus amylolyticus]